MSDTTAPYSTNYSWSAGATASGAKSVTATNGAGLTASSSFTVTPDSTGPAAFALSAPAAGATIKNGQAVSAAPSDALSGVAQVEFRYCAGATCSFATGTAIGTPDTTAPYTVSWSSQPADGQYTLLARATDNVGNTTDSLPVTVTVNNAPPPDTTPPSTPVLTLTETAPDAQVAGSTLFYNPTAGHAGTFTVAATTSDAESGIAQVAFPAVFGSDGVTDPRRPTRRTTAGVPGQRPRGRSPSPPPTGRGLTASSSFTVTPDSTGPTVAITAPANGATVTTKKQQAQIDVNASDTLSGVAQVEFRYCAGSSCTFAAGTAIGTPDTTAPYSVSWTSQPADGQYRLIARATDNVGNSTRLDSRHGDREQRDSGCSISHGAVRDGGRRRDPHAGSRGTLSASGVRDDDPSGHRDGNADGDAAGHGSPNGDRRADKTDGNDGTTHGDPGGSRQSHAGGARPDGNRDTDRDYADGDTGCRGRPDRA